MLAGTAVKCSICQYKKWKVIFFIHFESLNFVSVRYFRTKLFMFLNIISSIWTYEGICFKDRLHCWNLFTYEWHFLYCIPWEGVIKLEFYLLAMLFIEIKVANLLASFIEFHKADLPSHNDNLITMFNGHSALFFNIRMKKNTHKSICLPLSEKVNK